VLRETLFLEGKEELVCFPYFVPRELHGHRVVALRPGEFFQDTVEVLAGNVHFPGPFVLFPEVPEEAVVDLGSAKHSVFEDGLSLWVGMNLSFDGDEGHSRFTSFPWAFMLLYREGVRVSPQ